VLLADVEQGAEDDQREPGLRRDVPQRLGRQRISRGLAPDVVGDQFGEGGTPWTFVDRRCYTDLATDYTAMIELFKAGSGGSPVTSSSTARLPPDFNTFWKQASQQDWNPKLATVAKVMLFPTDVYALGDLSNNVATDCWFSPNAPYKSSLFSLFPPPSFFLFFPFPFLFFCVARCCLKRR